jgi:major vault protein
MKKGNQEDTGSFVVNLSHNQYIHIKDKNTNTTRIAIGPLNFIKQESEQIVNPATEMIKLPPNHYCVIKNPVVRDEDGEIVDSEYGESKVRFEELEIRTQQNYPDPFPLYPYEQLYQDVKKFVFLKDNEALVLKALRPFVDKRDGDKERFINDEYLFKGPGTYEPRIDEEIKKKIEAIVVLPNNALLLKAIKDTVDAEGTVRKAGSCWLHRKTGLFMPTARIEVLDIRKGKVLNDMTALHLRATEDFKDFYGNQRKAGEEWLIDKSVKDVHILDA